jgi:hypothetical protein
MTMATCDMGFEHEDAVPAEPEVIPVPVDAGTGEADVEIAKIDAKRDVEVEKIRAGVVEDDLRAEVESLRGELRGVRETLDRIAPEPEPEPELPAPAPVVIDQAPEVPPPPADEPKHREAKRKTGFF